MPMVLLVCRLLIESIFKNNYGGFMGDAENEAMVFRLVNGIITETLDPNIFYSRFSFLESGKDAIDQKFQLHKGRTSSTLPPGKSKYYTRSTLMKNLIPQPSEGRVRAKFTDTPKFGTLA